MTEKRCDNLIELPLELRPKNTADLHLVVKRDSNYCLHRPVIVDERKRCVYCATCKAPLDPFAELLKVANEHERYRNDMQEKKAETKGAQARLDLLNRLETNTRARLRKLGVKTTGHWLDRVLDWAEEFAKKTGRSYADRNYLQYELENAYASQRLSLAMKALDDGVGMPAIEMAMQTLEEMRAALESHAAHSVPDGKPEPVRAQRGKSQAT
jgi:hypothetical protein